MLLRPLVAVLVSLAAAGCGGEPRQKLQECLPTKPTDPEPPTDPAPIPGLDPDPTAPPHFVEVSQPMGLAYHEAPPYDGVSTCAFPKYCECNLFTGAAAVGDYDNDGYPDLYVSRLFNTPILFHNRGDGTFEDRTAAAGLALFGNWNGAAWLDIDDDGDLDLMALAVGTTRHSLFVNQGNGTFVEDAIARGVAEDDGEGKLATSVAVGDFDRDGWLDLHLGEWSMKGLPGPDPGPPFPEPTHPGHTRLFRNLGAANPGHFEDVTVSSGALADPPDEQGFYTRVYTFANALVDFDGDDWPDLALTGDFATSRFLWNDAGHFVEATKPSGLGKDSFGMGASVADLDEDGQLDWYVGSISGGPACVQGVCSNTEYGNHLYRYAGGRQFEDLGPGLGISEGYWAWGVSMFDMDNDGDLDVAGTNGVDYPFVPPGQFFSVDPNRLWVNDGGTFTERSTELGFVDTRKGKGLVTLDFDRDGDLDVFVANNADLPTFFRNDGAHGDWLRVRVLNERGRDAFGAKVRVRVAPGAPQRLRVVGVGTHFLGQSEIPAHFGLGAKSTKPVAEVEVHWPDTGATKVLTDVTRNQELVVTP